ncbi:MAG: methylated-DNA--[protein]-cysteine S-methyltransferase [Candidatus Eisenbacteria bacterium]
MNRVYRVVESPIGPLTLVGVVSEDIAPTGDAPRPGVPRPDGNGGSDHHRSRPDAVLQSIWFSSSKQDKTLQPNAKPYPAPSDAVRDEAALADAAVQLDEYFRGVRHQFDLRLDPIGTEFQRRVWEELTRIPYGAAISYRELAVRIGKPDAVRAVGSANGRNPLPIVIPCHRVIASDGTLAGFGGGIPAKQFLLRLEGVDIPSSLNQLDLTGC